jgi:hypothetical protein
MNFLVPNTGAFEIAPPPKGTSDSLLVKGYEYFDYISVIH